MARKNSPGCYCCDECHAILQEELPCIDPPTGYTLHENWSGGACCKCIYFKKEYEIPDPAWECYDVSVVNSELEVSQNWLAVEIPPPPVVCGGSCETLRAQGDYYCCTSEPFISATSITTGEASWTTRIQYRRFEDILQVCVRKDVVTCDGVSETKWIVHARLFHTLVYQFIFHDRVLNVQREFSNVEPCFSINDSEFIPSNCQCQLSYSAPLSADCGDTLPILGGGLLPVDGETTLFNGAYFDYVLFFDEEEWPPASFLLDSSAVPNGCEYRTCNSGGTLNFDNTACIGYSTFPDDLRPCWCDAELSCEQVTVDVSLDFNCISPATLAGCNCDPENPPFVSSCGPFDSYQCGTYLASSVYCNVNGVADASTGCENLFLGQWSSLEGWVFGICGTDPFFVGNGPAGFGGNYCSQPEPCSGFAPCDACCQEYGDCQCASKYSQSVVETYSHTQDFECTWIPWSYCWTRPTITLQVQPCT